MPRELWAVSPDGVRIEILEWCAPSVAVGVTPIVAMHGGIGSARTWEAEGAAATAGRLGGRPRCLAALSRRGMGRSDAPVSGYRVDSFVEDLETVVQSLGYERFVVVGHSLGVPIVLSFAARKPAGIAGIVLGDYGPRYPRLDEAWVDEVERRYRSGRLGELSLDAVRQTSAESRETSLVDAMATIECPVLVVTGDGEPISLTSADRKAYEDGLRDVQVLVIPGANHMLSVKGDAQAFHDALGAFVSRFDNGSPSPTQLGQ